jgi:hypothetical protein
MVIRMRQTEKSSMSRVCKTEWAIAVLDDVQEFLAVNGMHESAAAVSVAAASVRRDSGVSKRLLTPLLSEPIKSGNVIRFSVVSRAKG